MSSRAVSNPQGESNRSTLNTPAQAHTPNSNVIEIPPNPNGEPSPVSSLTMPDTTEQKENSDG